MREQRMALARTSSHRGQSGRLRAKGGCELLLRLVQQRQCVAKLRGVLMQHFCRLQAVNLHPGVDVMSRAMRHG